ncbi:MAG: OmpH family outer membrane protein [Holosporales bacterium]|jgi:Skp family chaperone for outer membrane proteins|nr:OmpH family outer membrane protein [Holosporales bacterium]
MVFSELLKNKNLLVLVLSVLIVASSVFLIVKAATQENSAEVDIAPATKIAIIDSMKLKSEALCFKALRGLESRLTEVISKMKEEENKAKAEYEKIRNGKDKKERIRNIEKNEEKWRQTAAKLTEEIQEIRNLDEKLSTTIKKKLDEAIKLVAEEHGIDIVLNDRIIDVVSVFYANKASDITNAVIRELNKITPAIDLDKLK